MYIDLMLSFKMICIWRGVGGRKETLYNWTLEIHVCDYGDILVQNW